MANYIGPKETEALRTLIDKGENIEESERTRLFETILHPAFKKLVKNLIYKLNQSNTIHSKVFEDETISHLYRKVYKFDFNRKSSNGAPVIAFSFFNLVAQNFIKYLIKKEANLKHVRLQNTVKRDSNENNSDEFSGISKSKNNEFLTDNSYITSGEDENYFIKFIQVELARFIVKTQDKKEKIFLKNIIQILDSFPLGLQLTKKNDFYFMIRSMSQFNNREIGKYRNKIITQYYPEIKRKYLNEIV